MKKFFKIAFVSAACVLVLSLFIATAIAQEFCRCTTRCRTDSGGHTICRTECRGQCG